LGRRPPKRAWKSLTGAAGTVLSALIIKDRHDWLFYRTLDLYCLLARPEVVHIHGYRLGAWQGVVWGQRHRLPTIFEEHSSPSREFGYQVDALNSPHRPTMMIAVSKAGLEELRQRFGSTVDAAIVRPIIDEPRASDVLERDASAHRSALTITCSARLSPEKGLEYLLLAAQRLAPRYPSLRFVIYGDGPLKDDLLRETGRLGLADSVRFSGSYPRSELPGIMLGTDIFVLPSLTEGLPLVIIEAMAYRRPIVATNVGGIPDLITDSVTGLLVPPADPETLTDALATLVEDPGRRRELGVAAYQAFLAGGFTAKAVANQMVALYSRAIERNASTYGDRRPR